MQPDFDAEDQDYINSLVERFDHLVSEGVATYFDSDELEEIIEHYFLVNQPEKAKAAIDYALNHFPGYSSFAIRNAHYYSVISQSQRALDLLDSIQQTDPDEVDIYKTRAAIYSQLEKSEDAIRQLKIAVKKSPVEDHNDLYVSIAFEYETIANFNSAISYLSKALKTDPDNENLIHEIGFCYESAGKIEEGIEYFEKFTDKYPYSRAGWYNMGLNYLSLGLYEKSIESFDYCIAIDPAFTAAYYSKAHTYEIMELYNKAISTYRQTIEVEEPDGMLYYFIGDCYEKSEKFEQAIENYRKSVELENKLSDSWIGLGYCLGQLGKYDEALVHIKKALTLEKDNADYWYIYADTLWDLDKLEAAEKAFIKVTELEPVHSDIWFDLSDFYAEQGDFKKALDTINEGMYHLPENTNLIYRKIAYLLSLGYEKEAISELHIVLTQDFNGHQALLEYSSLARSNTSVLVLIETYRNLT